MTNFKVFVYGIVRKEPRLGQCETKQGPHQDAALLTCPRTDILPKYDKLTNGRAGLISHMGNIN